MTLPTHVTIVEVGPRDGLQNEPGVVPTDVKVTFIDRLAATGLPVVEATSFVHPRWVPQLADAADVLASITPVDGVRYPVLVPNETGLDRALEAGVSEVAVFGAASEAFSKRNLNRTIDESLAMFAPVMARATEAGLRVRGYVSTVLGCPFQGEVPHDDVARVTTALLEMGCAEISLGDTIGVGTAGQVHDLLAALAPVTDVDRLAVHMHDTYGQGLANTLAAFEAGVTIADASAGGLGGCPYAPGAKGNLATEDLVWALDRSGVHTGVNLGALVDTTAWMADQLGRAPVSRAAQAILSKRDGDTTDPLPADKGEYVPLDPELLWSPDEDAWETTRLGQFARAHAPSQVGDYQALWRWSVDDLPGFWQAAWEFLGIEAHEPPSQVLADDTTPGAVWFPGARLNYAEHMLAGNGLSESEVAVVAESQTRPAVSWTLGELRDQVARCAAGLRRLGVGEGDRVAGYLPNVPETLVAMLATASLGAVWSSCAPEFGTRSVVDRWSQIEPDVLLVVDGYVYGDKRIARDQEVAEIRAALPSVRHTVLLGYLDTDVDWDDTLSWEALCAPTDEPLTFTPVAFDHPLYVLYSSGTTGLPKPIVHGDGGILLEHAKSLGLHLDLGPGDRFFWFSTTGWMMWNYLVSGLLVGSAIVMFDGNPGHPDMDTLWDLVERTGTTYMGVSAPFLMACRKQGLTPGADHDLSAVRAMGSTGAPLPADGFRWVYEAVGDHLQLGSVSGGTDVCTAFVGSAPVLPVHAGVIPCRMLGCRVEAYDEDGQPVIGTQGELVITAPMPSMPVGFWGDDDGTRYHDAYFDTFPGVWRHGDWITIHTDGSCVITGRSDATLNRGGVRLGTAEFYAVVEALDGVADSLVVHLEDDQGGMGELLLFVAPQPGHQVDDMRTRIARALRADLSPRHVPDEVVAVPAVPRTLSGKKLEVPVKRILQGTHHEDAASTGALSDPTALNPYMEWRRSAPTSQEVPQTAQE